MENFFTLDNLTALREIALRRCADRVNRLTDMARIRGGGDYHTEEHVLACLSSAPSNGKNGDTNFVEKERGVPIRGQQIKVVLGVYCKVERTC